MSTHEWKWFDEERPPSDTVVLITVYNDYLSPDLPTPLYLLTVDTSDPDILDILDEEYVPVAWMVAPTLPDIEVVRTRLNKGEKI